MASIFSTHCPWSLDPDSLICCSLGTARDFLPSCQVSTLTPGSAETFGVCNLWPPLQALSSLSSSSEESVVQSGKPQEGCPLAPVSPVQVMFTEPRHSLSPGALPCHCLGAPAVSGWVPDTGHCSHPLAASLVSLFLALAQSLGALKREEVSHGPVQLLRPGDRDLEKDRDFLEITPALPLFLVVCLSHPSLMLPLKHLHLRCPLPSCRLFLTSVGC